MITQRAWLVGVVGFCFYLIAIVNTLPAFYQALTWLSFGVLASSLAIAFLSLIGLRAAWRVPHAVVTESVGQTEDGPIVEVQMANVGTLNKTGILIEVQIERIDASGEKSQNLQLTRRFLMEALPSGSSLQTALPLLHLPRGRYRVVQLKLIGSDTLGLFRIQKRVSSEATFASVLDMKKPSRSTRVASSAAQNSESFKSESFEIVIGPAALARHDLAVSSVMVARSEGGAPASRYLGQGEDVRGTRLYAAGDDLRRVHWKSTARKGQLVVKEFHHTVQEQVLVVWDGAAGTRWGELREDENSVETIWRDTTAAGGFNSEEWSLRVAASLCRALLENRRPCALLRLDSEPASAGLATGAQSAPAQYSALTMNQVNETLADARANRENSLQESLQPFRAGHRASEVYLVTASLASDVARAVNGWRSEGANVEVALINGAAFLESASSRNRSTNQSTPASRRKTSTTKQNTSTQSWREMDGANAVVRQAEVIAENYRLQARALRAAGARVVLVEPEAGSREFLKPLHIALQELFDKTNHAQNSRVSDSLDVETTASQNFVAPDWSTPAQPAPSA